MKHFVVFNETNIKHIISKIYFDYESTQDVTVF